MWSVGAALLFLIGVSFARPQTRAFTPRDLSPYEMEKAERLVRERLPCLGCHELDGEGGRLGPSLSSLKGSRSPEYVYAMIADPQGTVPGSMMPRVPMAEATRDLVASYLLEREASESASPPLVRPEMGEEGQELGETAALYGRLCAGCHGSRGDGDGVNAPFLPVQPTAHSDAVHMSRRPDDSLFDAIYAGGYVMGRSPLMPAYGETLSREQIRSLVEYLRRLCACQGPGWSRDGR